MGWHAATTKVTDLVLTPLRIALWDRGRQGCPVEPGQLLHHSDAGSQYTSIRFTGSGMVGRPAAVRHARVCRRTVARAE